MRQYYIAGAVAIGAIAATIAIIKRDAIAKAFSFGGIIDRTKGAVRSAYGRVANAADKSIHTETA